MFKGLLHYSFTFYLTSYQNPPTSMGKTKQEFKLQLLSMVMKTERQVESKPKNMLKLTLSTSTRWYSSVVNIQYMCGLLWRLFMDCCKLANPKESKKSNGSFCLAF